MRADSAFSRLLEWLDDGVDSHGERYVEMRRRLVSYFDRRHRPSADDLADETLNRIGRTLATDGAIAIAPPARFCYAVARLVLLEDLRREQVPVAVDDHQIGGASSGRGAGIPSAAICADTQGDSVPRQIVYTPKAARPPATYSQAVKAAGLVFVSGTAPHDAVSGQITGTTIQEQTRQCLKNIAAILEEAGSSIDKIVAVTVVLADEDDFAGMNEEWMQWFPSNPPARQGAKLPARIPGLRISIAAIAEA